MTIEHLFNSASSTMTLVSFVTFIGIVWWTFSGRRKTAFDAAAQLPFADDDNLSGAAAQEHRKEARCV